MTEPKPGPPRKSRAKNPPPFALAPNKKGPAPKLSADSPTLKTIRALGQIMATSRECAAFLDVSEPTWIKFKAENPSVGEALALGQGHGRISLRRAQIKVAEAGNPTMLIWLGKNHLGQTDKVESTTEHKGTINLHLPKIIMLDNGRGAPGFGDD